ncbi:MAG TPA: NAD+ synthase [Limnochordia bacterium]|nr:NAD+ synthase [Limnochordia bacterium]
MQIYVAQVNPKVGDLKGNSEILRQVLCGSTGAELVVFPELFLSGFPPQDLLRKPEFLDSVQDHLVELQGFTKTCPERAVIIGTPWMEGERLFNAAVLMQNGAILAVYRKQQLSRFRGFDETVYFSPGPASAPIELGEHSLGLSIGLELDQVRATKLKAAGADVIINLAAIPFRLGEEDRYLEDLASTARATRIPIFRVAQVGANDGLIFSGGSFAVDRAGNLKAILPDFQTAGAMVDLKTAGEQVEREPRDETAQVYQALVLGLRDYVRKSGMQKAIIGLSGGLDSAVSACIAAEALGPVNIWGVTQPGPFSGASSVEDAQALALNLGIRFDILPITDLYEATLTSLRELFSGTEMNVAEENIQARLRGNQLMALSNKFGGLVLTNSNKSELAVGYCTLYGDMSGGLAPIADCYKTMVYQLAYYINREREIIPWNTIDKPPSAELRPNQRDDESLPPYDILDGIIKLYLDEGLGPTEIIAQGFDEETVCWVIRTIDNNDYKRRQAALILRITTPILGDDRKMPLAARKEF